MPRILIAVILTASLGACGDDTDSYDTGYTGAHGVGIIVDNPDFVSDDPNTWPICSDGVRYPDCRNSPLGY